MFASYSSGNHGDYRPPVGSHDRQFRGVFAGLWLIIACVIASFSVLSFVMNSRCQAAFRSTIYHYPGAQVITDQAEYLGTQRVIMTTTDDTAQVEQWFIGQVSQVMRRAVVTGDFTNIPARNWLIEPLENSGADGVAGSRITFSTTCP